MSRDWYLTSFLGRKLIDTYMKFDRCADIQFVKNGKLFTLSTTSFGDCLFNKGGLGMDGTNALVIY
jgi:hypothetical protein